MPALSPWKRPTIVIGLGAVLAMGLTPCVAYAGGLGDVSDEPGNTILTGASDPANATISATAGVQYDTSKNGTPDPHTPTAPLTPTNNWTPPPCWYQPTYTPAQMKASSETVWSEDSPSAQWKNGQRDYFVNGKPYTNFNLAKTGRGYFWAAYTPASSHGEADAGSCTDEPFWVGKGRPAPPGHRNAVTPQVLAELAYKKILIPQGTAHTNPAGPQTVNLPTWMWLDGLDAAAFRPVSVTAYLPGYGISATTTAEPVGMRIDPGTADARLYPPDGECPLDGGRIGTPYATGAGGEPPCGVTFLRSTQGAGHPYRLTATVSWAISWTGTDQSAPKALPAGAFGTSREVTVREIQTVNRRGGITPDRRRTGTSR